MKNLILIMLMSVIGAGNAIAQNFVEEEGLCRTFRMNDKVYSLGFGLASHNGSYLSMKRFDNAQIGRDMHNYSILIMSEGLFDFGLEKVKVVPSGDKRCNQEVRIVQVDDSDGNNMDLRISFIDETTVSGLSYYKGWFESLNVDGKPLPEQYRQLACSNRNVDDIKSVLISKCSKARETNKEKEDNSQRGSN